MSKIYGYKPDDFIGVQRNLYKTFLNLQKKNSFYGDATLDISLQIAIMLGIEDDNDEFQRLIKLQQT